MIDSLRKYTGFLYPINPPQIPNITMLMENKNITLSVFSLSIAQLQLSFKDIFTSQYPVAKLFVILRSMVEFGRGKRSMEG